MGRASSAFATVTKDMATAHNNRHLIPSPYPPLVRRGRYPNSASVALYSGTARARCGLTVGEFTTSVPQTISAVLFLMGSTETRNRSTTMGTSPSHQASVDTATHANDPTHITRTMGRRIDIGAGTSMSVFDNRGSKTNQD